jgi:hypothetical protein
VEHWAWGLLLLVAMTQSTRGDDDPTALRQRVRAALGAGLLPLGRLTSVVRRGSGGPCLVCGRAIEPNELEYEVQLDDQRRLRAVFVHEPCYRVWRVETTALARKAGHRNASQ